MKDAGAYRTIGEVAAELAVPQHVLRFWEGRFSQVDPLKRGGGRRYYRPDQVALLAAIKTLLYREGYTIKGVQRLLKEKGAKQVAAATLADRGSMPEPTKDVPPLSNGGGQSLADLAEELEDCRGQLAAARLAFSAS
jgi:DNA-binding transcriptional MerR regulator